MLSDLCNTHYVDKCQHKTLNFSEEEIKKARDHNYFYLSDTRRASIRLAELYRLADWHNENGIVLDKKKWLLVLAATLSCSKPGPIIINKNSSRYGRWEEFDFDTLRRAALRCKIEATNANIINRVHDTIKWRKTEAKKRGINEFTGPLSAKYVGQLLGVTAIMRYECRAWNIQAIDETKEDREERKRRKDRERKEELRRERGAKQLAENISKIKPWLELGISRSTWYLRRKPKAVQLASDTMSRDQLLTSKHAGDHLSHGVSEPKDFMERENKISRCSDLNYGSWFPQNLPRNIEETFSKDVSKQEKAQTFEFIDPPGENNSTASILKDSAPIIIQAVAKKRIQPKKRSKAAKQPSKQPASAFPVSASSEAQEPKRLDPPVRQWFGADPLKPRDATVAINPGEQYVVRKFLKGNMKPVAHILNGDDTFCLMFAGNSKIQVEDWKVIDAVLPGQWVCTNCMISYRLPKYEIKSKVFEEIIEPRVDEFLILREPKPDSVAHIWRAGNAMCRLFDDPKSKNRPQDWIVAESAGALPICVACVAAPPLRPWGLFTPYGQPLECLPQIAGRTRVPKSLGVPPDPLPVSFGIYRQYWFDRLAKIGMKF